jgi:tetratricopeptide (TPR) repeat protein
LLYELLTGRTPFDTKELLAKGHDAVMRKIREEEPPKPSTRLSTLQAEEVGAIAANRGAEPARLCRLLRGDLDWIVMKALEKDRTRRYETASSLGSDVDHYLRNEAVFARPPSTWYRFRKLVRRNKLAFGAAACISFTLVLGLGISTWLFLKERDAHRRAVAAEQAERALRQKAQASELSARALQLWNEGDLAEAEATSRQLLDLWRKLLGADHPQVATCLETLAAIVRDQGHVDEALRLYGEALKLNRAGEQDLRKLNEALALGNYDGVGRLLNQQLPQARSRVQLLELLRERGLSAARQGHWREAAAEYARLSELNPADAETGHALASLLVYAGYEAGYQGHCSRLLTQFGKTTDPVLAQAIIRGCLLLPCPATNLAAIVPLAANLSQAGSNHWAAAYFSLAQGASCYRNGRFSEAIASLQQLGNANKSPEREAQALFFLAMAQHRLGLVKEAKETLAHAIQLIGNRLQRIEDGILGENWSEWIRAHVLLREARLMIED